MHENCDTCSNKHRQVSIYIGCLVNDASGNTHEHLLKNGNKSNQTYDKDDKTDEENNSSRNFIISARSSILEESRASSALVTGDKTDTRTFSLSIWKLDSSIVLASSLWWNTGLVAYFSSNAIYRVEDSSFRAVSLSSCKSFGDFLVCLDDKSTKWRDDLLDRTFPLLSLSIAIVRNHSLGEGVQVSSNYLNWKQDSNREKVKHIVNSCSCECTFKLISVTQVSHCYNGIGYRGSDISSHNHVDTRLHSHTSCPYQRNNDGGGRRRRLNQNGTEDSNHKASDWIGIISEKRPSGTSSQYFCSSSKQLESQKKEVEEEAHHYKSNKDESPLFCRVNTAGTANLSPSSISDVLSVFLSKINITKVSRSSSTILARS